MIQVTFVTEGTRDSVTGDFVTESRLSPILRRATVNHTQRIARVARQRRSLTKALVREAVERYLEELAEETASGEWVDTPGIGKVQVSREEGKGFVTSIPRVGWASCPP